MNEIVIVGAGGFGRELFQYFQDVHADHSNYRMKGFLDDDPGQLKSFGGVPGIIGDTNNYEIQADDLFLISIGDPTIREKLAQRLAGRGAKFATLIHPTAYVAATARVGAGCIIAPFACVGSNVELEVHVLLNLYSAAGHDAQIGAYSVFSPYAVANGGGRIGAKVFFGTHAVVTPNVQVGADSKIAAGAVVYRDVPTNSLASGNPAKAFRLSPAAGVNQGQTP